MRLAEARAAHRCRSAAPSDCRWPDSRSTGARTRPRRGHSRGSRRTSPRRRSGGRSRVGQRDFEIVGDRLGSGGWRCRSSISWHHNSFTVATMPPTATVPRRFGLKARHEPDRHPFRPLAHRTAACRQYPHRTPQLDVGAQSGRTLPAAARRYRSGTIDRRICRCDPRRSRLARPHARRYRAPVGTVRSVRAAFQELRAAGRVYPAYETAQELDLKRKILAGRGLPPIYDRAALAERCRSARLEAEGIAPHWRFKLDHDAPIEWDDLVRGAQHFDPKLQSIRSSAAPTAAGSICCRA
jgi:hypothetical protein